MITVCDKSMCNGCMACIEKCQMNAITIEKNPVAYNAVIDESKCVSCKTCFTVCPRNQKEILFKRPLRWYQGWADSDIRENSSSGGAATAILSAFVKNDGYVCSCLFRNGQFVFELSNRVATVKKFAGSKYVKSNPEGIYGKIQHILKDGKRVLFLGLPCQVAGVKNFVSVDLQKNLYTVDLICHGTPDQKILNKYLADHNIEVKAIEDITFRKKDDFRIRSDYKPIVIPNVLDSYLYTFLRRINYTENCYSCQFAKIERISDLTLGDSWGSTLDEGEQKKGISLFLLQTDKGKELVDMAGLTLFDVDQEKAIKNNEQLNAPAERPTERKKFFKLYEEGVNYDVIAFKLAPKIFVRQKIKEILIKTHIISGG